MTGVQTCALPIYMEALAKYNTHLNDEDVKAKVTHFIEEHLAENNTPEVKKFLFHCIDLTTLKCTDSEESVMKFTEKVNDFVDKYPDLSNVAAICVYPNMAEIVNDTLEADNVNIACVSGGFPSSQTFIEVKVAETAIDRKSTRLNSSHTDSSRMPSSA